LKPELRLERAKARNEGQIHQIEPIRRRADAGFRQLDQFACSEKVATSETSIDQRFPRTWPAN
jgi:hypothetical protein